jgi:hypothetical protein
VTASHLPEEPGQEPHSDDLGWDKNPTQPWRHCTRTVRDADIAIRGQCQRCLGYTVRTLELVVKGIDKLALQSLADENERFPVQCQCHHDHAGRPEKAPEGCGAYWWAYPSDGGSV